MSGVSWWRLCCSSRNAVSSPQLAAHDNQDGCASAAAGGGASAYSHHSEFKLTASWLYREGEVNSSSSFPVIPGLLVQTDVWSSVLTHLFLIPWITTADSDPTVYRRLNHVSRGQNRSSRSSIVRHDWVQIMQMIPANNSSFLQSSFRILGEKSFEDIWAGWTGRKVIL